MNLDPFHTVSTNPLENDHISTRATQPSFSINSICTLHRTTTGCSNAHQRTTRHRAAKRKVCPEFCVNDLVLFLGMGSGKGSSSPSPDHLCRAARVSPLRQIGLFSLRRNSRRYWRDLVSNG